MSMKKGWRKFGVAVVGLVLLSMLVPLVFLLGLYGGFQSSSRHSIAITEGGIIYGWGDGEQNQLGKIESEVQLLPVILPSLQRKDLQILYVVASGEHTIAVFEPHEGECLTPMDQRTGSYCSYDLLVKHAVDILEDLVIALADGIATMYLELISVDNITLSEIGLTNLVQSSYMATRSLERFRNEVALNRWLQDNFSSVIAIYEDQFNLWTLQSVFVKKPAKTENYNHGWLKKVNPKKMVHEELLKDIVICKCVLQMKRTKELRALSGWRYYYSIFLEFSDVMGPLIRELLTRLGRDVYGSNCQEVLGWKYERAFDATQKYKEGKFILEKSKIMKEDW